jgi:hypothetical protein
MNFIRDMQKGASFESEKREKPERALMLRQLKIPMRPTSLKRRGKRLWKS